jgi:branched-chain amino acid transport system ATP-binding protein
MTALLHINKLHAYYGKSHVIQGLSLAVNKAEIVALLGRNGVGRSSTLKSIMGLIDAKGSIEFKQKEILGLATFEIALAGIAYVPEQRDIFSSLTVEQNLLLGQKQKGTEEFVWTMEDMFQLFPILAQRRHNKAGVLSGGEQQMLSLCRSLLGNPELLLVDEPTEGLAPKIIASLVDFFLQVKHRGVSILLVEQKLNLALDIADRVYVMGHGHIVYEGLASELKGQEALRKEWLEI